MAGWLEQLEETGTGLIDKVGSAAGDKVRNELGGDGKSNPDRPQDQPEKQHDTELKYPDSGQAESLPNMAEQIRQALHEYKWFAVGGLALVSFVVWQGAR